jgi:hypothetical protein
VRSSAGFRLNRIALVATSILISGAAPPQDTLSPEEFVRSLYLGYEVAAGPDRPQPLGPEADSIFDTDLVALIRREQSSRPQGVGGLVKTDPICDCVTWSGLRVQSADLQSSAAGRTTVDVTFLNGGKIDTLRYQLVNVSGQWLVHDIGSKTVPSLRHTLENELAVRFGPEPVVAPEDTTYTYGVDMHDDGSVALRYGLSYARTDLSLERCSHLVNRAHDVPLEWHFQDLKGWYNGGCHVIHAALFETRDAFRAFLQHYHETSLVEDGKSLTLHVSLDVQPPNAARSIVIRLTMPGALPIIPGARQGAHDSHQLTWTFSRTPDQGLIVQAAAGSAGWRPTP